MTATAYACLLCGTEFEPRKTKAYTQVYCSRSCKERARKRRRPSQRRKPLCQCGTCTACSSRERSHRWRERNPGYMDQWKQNNAANVARYEQQHGQGTAEGAQYQANRYIWDRWRSILAGPNLRSVAEYKRALRCDPCSYCGGVTTDLDHIEPKHLGGSDDWDNYAPVCRPCNSRKNIRPALLHLAFRNGCWLYQAAEGQGGAEQD